jgi:CRP/FNR family cyclic AMP-dependent transcriptional regulator
MKRRNPAIDKLRQVTLFSACTNEELALISSRTTEHHSQAGDVLASEGRIGHDFVVIVEGTAKVLVADHEIARLGPGDFFGEIALLDDGPRTATVVAETDLVAEVSSQREFAELIAGAPNLAKKLLIGLARRLRAADVQLAS